jgi:hypothetical protein
MDEPTPRSTATAPSPTTASSLAPVALRLAALWILVGASYKLFAGSPNDLPEVVRSFFLGPALTFRLAIAIELTIAFTCLLSPRAGWRLLVLQYLVFVAILLQLVASGAKSCGCLGSSVSIPPAVMLGVDLALLAAVLATRPWRAIEGAKVALPLIGLATVVAWAAPWLVLPPAAPDAPLVDETGAWRLPEELPRFGLLDPDTWVGRPLAETQLGVWIDVSKHSGEGCWVIYSPTCDHCATFLRQRESEFVENPRFYTFVSLGDPEAEDRVVDLMPPGEIVRMPEGVESWIVTPPWELELEDGVVAAAHFRGEDEQQ